MKDLILLIIAFTIILTGCNHEEEALPPIIPEEPVTRSVTINWEPITENTDGSAYTDPGGFYIFYKSATSTHVEMVGPWYTSYTIHDLGPEPYSFTMTAFNILWTQSYLSNEIWR